MIACIHDHADLNRYQVCNRMHAFKKKNFMAPFYGWGSTASRLQPLRGGNLLFTIQFPEIPGTHFIDVGCSVNIARGAVCYMPKIKLLFFLILLFFLLFCLLQDAHREKPPSNKTMNMDN